MLRLILFRHAKSSWDVPSLSDVDRPLGERGRRATPVMAQAMLDLGLAPSVIVCSAAVRTRQTLELVLATAGCAGWRATVAYDPALYLAEPNTILARLATLPQTVREAMVVGHNPGLQETAIRLCGSGAEASLQALRTKVPTASLIVIQFPDLDDWPNLARATGRLQHFVTPASMGSTALPGGEQDDGE